MKTIDVEGTTVFIEGTGTHTVLMIHGWPDTAALWDRQVEALRAQYRCVRFSLPGFDVRKPAQKASVDSIVALVEKVVQTVSPSEPITLLLHDWGCIFGYQFANWHPTKVGRVIALDIGDTSSKAFLSSLTIKVKLFLAGYQLFLAVAYALRWLPWLPNAMTRWMAAKLRAPAARSMIGAQQNYPYWLHWTGGFSGVRPFKAHCPVLYFYGKRKPFMFHSEQWLQNVAATKGGQVHAMKTGHWIMLDDAEGVNRIMLEWLWKQVPPKPYAASERRDLF